MVADFELSNIFNYFVNYHLINSLRGKKGLSSSKLPFFNINRDNDLLDKLILTNKRDLNIEIPNSLNRNIKGIYEYFVSDDEELYLKDWIFFSINEAIEIYKKYCSQDRNDVFDIAYKYAGLGHIDVLSCDLNTHLLFIRCDGGSNGWDREANYKELIKNGSKNYPKINFTQWVNNFTKRTYD